MHLTTLNDTFFSWKLGSFSSRMARELGSSWLVIANELKSWLGSAHYLNESSRAEPSRASHEASELMSFKFFVQPASG